ncbi:MAG: hypothetical protein IKP48_08155 [Bacteroidaceae bacterium]|nr:hypothetical protein [Bacteroidaceae bacterium]
MTHHAATAATADAFGNIEYWTCSRCGKYFTDSEGKTETTFGAVTTHDYGVSYIDEHGEQQTCTEFTFIESSNEDFNHYGTEGETNWYVVYGNVTINGQLNFDNYNTHLIICDGATLNISDGAYVSHSKNYLSIYGQAEGSGSIDANGDRGISALGGVTINGGTVTAKGSSNGIYSHYGVTINGGTVTATGSDNYESAGIYGSVITINGGIVTAKGNRDGISAGSVTINGGTATAMGYGLGIGNYDGVSTITLGWTDTTDRITSTATGTGGVSYKGTVSIKDGQYLYDGTEVFSGTVADLTKLQNVTLQPAVKITLPTFVTASGTGVINQADGTYALPGATVTLGAAAGYTASDYSITGVTINEAEGVYTFTMPAKDVEVSATCTSISLTANLAALNGVTKYWTTFYHPTLSYQLPAGAMALYMKEDMALYMLGDGDVVPAGTPVIIMGDTSSISITKLDSTTVTNPTDNKLSGTAVATAASSLTTGGKKVYVMSKVNETLGFYEFSGTTIPANKAYYVDD